MTEDIKYNTEDEFCTGGPGCPLHTKPENTLKKDIAEWQLKMDEADKASMSRAKWELFMMDMVDEARTLLLRCSLGL